MSRTARALLCGAAALVVALALVESVAARGGGRGGGGRGGGGINRGGGGFRYGGPAAWGSFGQNRPEVYMDRGEYDARGPAADGSFDLQYGDQGERQERRQERREERRDGWEDGEQDPAERLEDWRDYAEENEEYDDYYADDYGDAGVYWTLPCSPNAIAMGGVIYYVCDTTWYIRAYSNGEVVYTVVPNPTGH